jgi:hypothetical protein
MMAHEAMEKKRRRRRTALATGPACRTRCNTLMPPMTCHLIPWPPEASRDSACGPSLHKYLGSVRDPSGKDEKCLPR